MSVETRRLFILYRSPLLGHGLRNLLSGVPGLEVVGMGRAGQEEEVWNEIQRLAPDVVIQEHGGKSPTAKLRGAARGIQLIAVTLAQDSRRIYGHRDMEGRGLEGIVEAIALTAKRPKQPRWTRRLASKEAARAEVLTRFEAPSAGVLSGP
ncbi:MAG TPA: hypothetical protein VJO15_00205 [Dehalococcoidia bacterium]|nr:hypothetical protein [Dehalococcoidia bacterium]